MRGFLNELETSANLIHFSGELSTEYEIPAAITYVAQYISKAVVFDKVKGYDTPVVANVFSGRKSLSMAFGVKEDRLEETYMTRAKKPVKPRLVSSAPAQEVVIDKNINIQQTIPVLIHHEKDAGPYMTSAITIAKDPETGIRGMGVHRIQVKDKDTIGIYLGSPPLSNFLAKAERLDKPLDIAIASGVDPLTFCASAFYAPEGVDKFDIAGGFAEAPVDLVKCRSVDIEAPANAEFILEGCIIPHLREKEGPFGESTGYYVTFNNPVGKITTITHRSKPVYHGLMPFTGEEKCLAGVMLRPYLTKMIQEAIPEVRIEGLSLLGMGGLCVVQIDKKTEEDGAKVIDWLLSYPFTKIGVVTDTDVNIAELDEVAWAIATRVQPDKDVVIRSGLPGSMIDPSTSGLGTTTELSFKVTQTAKIGIDATKPLKELERFQRIDVPAEVKKKVFIMLQEVF